MSRFPYLKGRRAALAIWAALLMSFPCAGISLAAEHAAAQPSAVMLKQDINLLERVSKARAAIAKEASPAVVNITVEQKVTATQTDSDAPPFPFNDEFMRRFFGGQMPTPPANQLRHGLGSGIIVDAKGFVLTNNHVVSGADKITVKLSDGRQFPAKRVGTDPASDVAVLKIDAKDLPVAKLGNSDELQVGESVLAIGNPFGLDHTITSGIVSAKGRSEMGLADYENFIQTDASINPGNSGGPLLNLKGEVVGINTAIFGNSGGNMGIGFAIPINQARAVMTSLIANGKVVRGFLGVMVQAITPEIASAMNIPANQGVLVSGVTAESPAGRAGVKSGDVILTFHNQPMTSVNALRNEVASVKPGETVGMRVMRDGKPLDLSAKIEEQPKDMVAASRRGSSENGGQGSGEMVLGMNLQTLNPELAGRLGIKSEHGVVITNVDPNGPAARAGLMEGALLLEVNHHPVNTVHDVEEQVKEAPRKKYVLMLVEMEKADRYVAVQNS